MSIKVWKHTPISNWNQTSNLATPKYTIESTQWVVLSHAYTRMIDVRSKAMAPARMMSLKSWAAAGRVRVKCLVLRHSSGNKYQTTGSLVGSWSPPLVPQRCMPRVASSVRAAVDLFSSLQIESLCSLQFVLRTPVDGWIACWRRSHENFEWHWNDSL